VKFICLDKSVHMAAGECWIFDSWKEHNVINAATAARIHLVIDTIGTASFWDLVARSDEPPQTVPFDPSTAELPLAFENENFPVVMNPFEQHALAARMLAGLADPAPARLLAWELSRLHRQWHALWTAHRDRESGWPEFRAAIAAFDNLLPDLSGDLTLRNGVPILEALRQAIVRPALSPEVLEKRTLKGEGGAQTTPVHEVPPASVTSPSLQSPPMPAPPATTRTSSPPHSWRPSSSSLRHARAAACFSSCSPARRTSGPSAVKATASSKACPSSIRPPAATIRTG
jgi:hypothetical protein